MVTAKQRKKIDRKKLALRESLWGKIDESRLWKADTAHPGYHQVPRAMPLILKIMDDMSNGKPVSSTYFDLWCRTYNEEAYVVTNKPQEMAYSAGFGGQRAVRTWKDRMKILAALGFIDVKEGPSGPISYVLIWNPYIVIKNHHQRNTPGLQQAAYNALMERVIDIGAKDLDD